MKIEELPRCPQWLKDAKTEDADVLWSGTKLVWDSGTWFSGIWKGSEFSSGVWHDGVWKSGTFSGIWLDGDFEDGIFDGVWRDGIFVKGKFLGNWCVGSYFEQNFRNFMPETWGHSYDGSRGNKPALEINCAKFDGFNWDGGMKIYYDPSLPSNKNAYKIFKITIGCREFYSFAEARQHWVKRERLNEVSREKSLARLDQIEATFRVMNLAETQARAQRQRCLVEEDRKVLKATKKAPTKRAPRKR